MKIITSILALALMATAAFATPVEVGKVNVKDWYMCTEKDAPMQVLETAKTAGTDESFKIWRLLVDGGKCINMGLPIPMTVVSVVESATIAGEEYEKGVPLVLSVIELKDGDNTMWAITGEPIAK